MANKEEETQILKLKKEEEPEIRYINCTTINGINMYNLGDLAEMLGVTYRTMQNYIKDGKLKGVKIGGTWKISEENLNNFLNGN